MAQSRKRRARTKKEASAAESAADRLPAWGQHALCAGLLLAVSLAFFAPVHFSGGQLGGSDNTSWSAMAHSLFEFQAETGEPSLWDPNAFAGMPAFMINYAHAVPQLDGVPSFLRSFAWPTSHFFFLLLGTYGLVFFLTRWKLPGVLAACAYGLTTYIPIILVTGHNTKFIALAYVPWLALAFAYALRRPTLRGSRLLGGVLSALLFAAALAVNLRAGHVQITYYAAFLLGVWWLVELVGAARHGRGKAFGAVTGWLALGSVLGLLMVAQPYLVNAQYKAHTIRGSTEEVAAGEDAALDPGYAMRWSQGAGELLTLAVADAYGGSSRPGEEGATYWGPKPFTEGPHYLGGIVLLLAGLALCCVRRNVVYALGIGAFLMTLFALGRHFALLNDAMFAYFPLFDAFRAPETWLSVVAFALAVLAGLGLAYALEKEKTPAIEHARTRAVYVAVGGAVGIALLLVLAQSMFFDFEKPDEQAQIQQQLTRQIAQQQPDVSPQSAQVQQFVQQRAAEIVTQARESRADAFRGDALRTLIFLVLAGGVLVAARREAVPGWGAAAALALLVALDLGGVGRRYLNSDRLNPPQSSGAQVAEYGFDRYIVEQEEKAGGPGRFRVLSLEGDPSTTARPSFYYESLGGYHGAKLRLYQNYLDHILTGPQGQINEKALDLLSTRYVVAGGTLPGMEVVYRDEQTGLAVLRNPNAVPRAFFVGETEVISSPEATWERLRSDAFDPEETALLPAPLDGFETTPLDSSSTASVTLERFTANEITWTVNTDTPRLLVASEIYYPDGWEATVGGEAAPIYRVDYLLRGVPVPAGEHEVVMRFAPAGHRLGIWLSALSTALVYGGVLLLLGWAFVQRRRGEDVESDEEGRR